MAASASSLKEYSKRYESSNNSEDKTKKKKKKNKTTAKGVTVVDEVDPMRKKQVILKKGKPMVTDEEIAKKIEVELLLARASEAIGPGGSVTLTLPEGFEDAILSLPRKIKMNKIQGPQKMKHNVDLSPPRKTKRDNLEDLSPPRKRGNHVADLSTTRKITHNVDLSPPRKKNRNNLEHLSPPRKARCNDVGCFSPRRKSRNNGDDISPPRRKRHDSDEDLSPPRRSLRPSPSPAKQKPKSGLISSRDIKEERSKTRRAEQLRFQHMDPSETGENAAYVYRNKKTGDRISEEEKLKSEKKHEEKRKEMKIEWSEGLVQKREAEAKLEKLKREKKKPFSRTRDDPEVEKTLKERAKFGDPMPNWAKKKVNEEVVLPDLGDDERMKESGFIIPQDIPNDSWLKRGLDAAPNRYGIKPGRHWDGIDRSKGFEKELFTRINDQQATEAEAHLSSFADM